MPAAASEPQAMMPPPTSEDPAPEIFTSKDSGEPDPHAMVIDPPDPTVPEQGPVEVIDVDQERPPPLDFSLAPAPQPLLNELSTQSIDIPFEASKLPLDVAIFNSARAAGGDDKIRKYLQAVLVIGGTALIPGMAHALESRLAFLCVFFKRVSTRLW